MIKKCQRYGAKKNIGSSSPKRVEYDLTHIIYDDNIAIYTTGIDHNIVDSFVSSGDVMYCPQYPREKIANAHVDTTSLLKHLIEGREIRFYLDLNMASSIISLRDGASPYDISPPNGALMSAAHLMSFAWMVNGIMHHGPAFIEYSTNPNNSLEEANIRLKRFSDALLIQGPEYQRLTRDTNFHIDDNNVSVDKNLRFITQSEQTGQIDQGKSYQVALKIAHLKMMGMNGRPAFEEFINWLYNDHFFAIVPIAVAASEFLGKTKKPLSGLKMIPTMNNWDIIRRCMWDMTHVRIFNKLVIDDQENQKSCYIMCTHDKSLQRICSLSWDLATLGEAGANSLENDLGQQNASFVRKIVNNFNDRRSHTVRRAHQVLSPDQCISFTADLENLVYGRQMYAETLFM